MVDATSPEAWLERVGREIPANVVRGLDHVAQVAERLGINPPAPLSFVVAGTNGKGSTVAVLEQLLLSHGLSVGSTTSPHLSRFNERIRVNGVEADDAAIVGALEAVDAARGEVDLSYFEFAVLAALAVHRDADVAASVLEVGLGGRLDAVNIVDGDVTVIASIGLDHQAILGPDREAIGAEKAGILRPKTPLVFGGDDPPGSVLTRAAELDAPVFLAGREFGHDHDGYWATDLGGALRRFGSAPCAAAAANVATALQAAVLGTTEVQNAAWLEAAGRVQIPGRFERIHARGRQWVLDVGHNPDGAAFLAAQLAEEFPDRTVHCIVGCLEDKDIRAIVAPLLARTATLCFADTETWRARSATSMREAAGLPQAFAGTLQEAIEHTLAGSDADGVILACGSFDVVERTRLIVAPMKSSPG